MTMSTLRYIQAHQLKDWIHDTQEVAVLDVREQGQFGEDHLFFAVPLPYSELELHIGRLVPRAATRTVVYGDDATAPAVEAAARALARVGYTQVHILRGGIAAWKAAGYGTFAGVNLPSKTFGEIAEHVYHTPHISAAELNVRLRNGAEKILVVDGRPLAEYRKMNIPGSICCPNGELALRIGELAPDPDTTIVVNCAGRTRSIIGAQTLINLGVPNKVLALENGTQGWFLADLPLEHQSDRRYPESVSPQSLDMLRARSSALCSRFDIGTVDADTVKSWLADATRSVFLCDVRTEEEHAQGDLPAIVQHTPGGQLIQATDQYIGVRKAQIVLCDTDGIRAPVVASWLKQLGWQVVLLADTAALADVPAPAAPVVPLAHTQALPYADLGAFLVSHPQALLLDARPSQQFRDGSIEGAQWITRSQASRVCADQARRPVVLLGPKADRLALVAHELEALGVTDIRSCVVDGGFPQSSGLPVVSNARMADGACIDYLFFVHDRHDGNKAAARQYLAWETNLVAQIDARERDTFSFVP